jgi:formate dehydrogenase subunit delta
MSLDRLVYMANQIGDFFVTQHGKDPAIGIADHLKKFWDPRMRKQIVAHADQGGAGLKPEVLRAVKALGQPGKPPNPA